MLLLFICLNYIDYLLTCYSLFFVIYYILPFITYYCYLLLFVIIYYIISYSLFAISFIIGLLERPYISYILKEKKIHKTLSGGANFNVIVLPGTSLSSSAPTSLLHTCTFTPSSSPLPSLVHSL